MHTITKEQARNYFVRYHFLDRRLPKSHMDKVFSRLRTIQYDPLRVVGRNADLVLKARLEGFRPDDLERWLYQERSLIDGWDKMMNIYPMTDREMMTPISGRYARASEAHGRELLEDDFDRMAETVRQKLRDGQLLKNVHLTKEFDMGHQGKYRPFHFLDYLFHLGEAEIAEKFNTQKIYRHPKPPKMSELDEAFLDWYAYRRVEATGLIRMKRSEAWLGYYHYYQKYREPAIERLLEQGKIIPVTIEDVPGQFVMPSDKSAMLESVELPGEVRLLAPLDNFLWDRKMIEEIFDFRYRWEVYVPEKKRQWGYYVLPILQGDRLIGRLEPERVREGAFDLKQIWWEEGAKVDETAFQTELATFVDFVK